MMLTMNMKSGFSSGEIENRHRIYGSNDLEHHEGESIWSMILKQFNDTLVRILLVAAIVSFLLAWYGGGEGGTEITAFGEPLVIFLLILIVSVAIGFDAGVLSYLEYSEAAPWSEDEEEKVVGAGEEVLKRVSIEVAHGNEEGNHNNEGVLLKLIRVVNRGGGGV